MTQVCQMSSSKSCFNLNGSR